MNDKYVLYAMALGVLACAAVHAAEPVYPNSVLNNAKLRDYVTRFNADDEELYANIPNEEAFDFLDRNIPLFECPDQDIEGSITSAGGPSASTSRRRPTAS